MVSNDVRPEAGIGSPTPVLFVGVGWVGCSAAFRKPEATAGSRPACFIIARSNDPLCSGLSASVAVYGNAPAKTVRERRASDSCPTVTKSIDAIIDELHDEA